MRGPPVRPCDQRVNHWLGLSMRLRDTRPGGGRGALGYGLAINRCHTTLGSGGGGMDSQTLFCLEFGAQFMLLKRGAVNPNYPVLGVVISTKEERGGAVRRHMLATLKEPVPPPPPLGIRLTHVSQHYVLSEGLRSGWSQVPSERVIAAHFLVKYNTYYTGWMAAISVQKHPLILPTSPTKNHND